MSELTPLARVYRSLNANRAFVLDEGIAIRGKGTYHIKEKIKSAGGKWDAEKKYWVVPDIKTAVDIGALFYIRVEVPPHCHEERRVINVSHEEALAGIVRMGCGLCDCSFRCGDDVVIEKIIDGDLLDTIVEAKGEVPR